jgi:hypothetical protein
MVAKEWGMLPSQFRKLPPNDRAELAALSETLSDMQRWENHIDALEAEKVERKRR